MIALPAEAQIVTTTNRTLSDAAQEQAVMSRARPDFDPAGISVSSFRVYPGVQTQVAYDDNVFNSDVVDASDVSARLSPRVVVQSQWSQHGLRATAGAQIERYSKLKTENNDQYDVGLDSVVDFSRGLFRFGSSYARRVEPRGSLGDIFLAGDRIRYDLLSANGSATVQLANVQLTAGGTASRYTYLPLRINDTRVVQDYRDRDELTGQLRADYRVGPGLRLFLSGAYNDQRYRRRVSGFDQNSNGYAILGGVSFGLTELISGEIGVGYLSQSYADPRFGNIGGLAYNGRLIWNPTPLMTVTLSGSRSTQQSPFVNQAGILQDFIQSSLDYEVLRNLIVSAAGSIISNDYRGIDRHDRLYTEELRARYLINRSMEAGLVVSHRRQTTSGVGGRSYAGNGVSLSLTFRR